MLSHLLSVIPGNVLSWLERPAPPYLAWLVRRRRAEVIPWWFLLAMLAALVTAVLGGAAFPRLAYRLRWASRLRGRRLAAFVAFGVAYRFALLALRERVKEAAGRQHQLRVELREQLGREPTDEELIDRLGLPDDRPVAGGR